MRVHYFARILIISALGGSCNAETPEQKEAQEQKARAEVEAQKQQAEFDEIVEAFTKKYNGDRTWENDLKYDFNTSTMQLQKSLIRPDGRPIVVFANLMDIELHDHDFSLLFYVPKVGQVVVHPIRPIVLHLTCSLQESEIRSLKIDRARIWDLPRHMVAAQVQTIRQTHQFGEASLGSWKMEMEFRAEGKCIAFQELKYVRKEPIDSTPRSAYKQKAPHR